MATLPRPTFQAIPLVIGASLTSLGIYAIGAAPAWSLPTPGDRLLLAQQVVDGLPPPPSSPVANLADFPAPPAADTTTAQPSDMAVDQLFMVAVNGNSPLLLEQVRQVQPTALIQEYNGQPIILVGAYETAAQAQAQINALATNGIRASVTPVPSSIFEPVPLETEGFAGIPELPPADFNDPSSTAQSISASPAAEMPVPQAVTTPREIEFSPVPTAASSVPAPQPVRPVQAVPPSPSAALPSVSPTAELADNAYYIVIPGSSESLDTVQDQVILLGGRHDVVTKRERPLGPHVLVGPFTDRRSASRWNGFFRDFGMDARVYYRR
jgi:cell division protein FtsN